MMEKTHSARWVIRSRLNHYAHKSVMMRDFAASVGEMWFRGQTNFNVISKTGKAVKMNECLDMEEEKKHIWHLHMPTHHDSSISCKALRKILWSNVEKNHIIIENMWLCEKKIKTFFFFMLQKNVDRCISLLMKCERLLWMYIFKYIKS